MVDLFHLLLDSFCCFTALFLNDTVIRLICFCFKKVHPCVVKSDASAISAKPCLLHLIVFPFDCFAVLLYTKPQDVLMTVRASSAHGMSKKKSETRSFLKLTSARISSSSVERLDGKSFFMRNS